MTRKELSDIQRKMRAFASQNKHQRQSLASVETYKENQWELHPKYGKIEA